MTWVPLSDAAERVLEWIAGAELVPERKAAMGWGVTLAKALVNENVVQSTTEAGMCLAELENAGYIVSERRTGTFN